MGRAVVATRAAEIVKGEVPVAVIPNGLRSGVLGRSGYGAVLFANTRADVSVHVSPARHAVHDDRVIGSYVMDIGIQRRGVQKWKIVTPTFY